MKLSAPLSSFALLASTALAAPAASLPAYSSIQTALVAPEAFLPPCSSIPITPCSCPYGTSYEESLTFEVVGIAAEDFRNLTSDYFNSGWLGILPVATRGPNNTPGSTRTHKLGERVLVEQLTELKFGPKGGFIQKFEQLRSTIPVEYPSGNGTFSGYWVTLEAKYVFEYETAVVWSVYACSTGHPQNYAGIHEFALNNAAKILQQQGKVKGLTKGPFSVQDF